MPEKRAATKRSSKKKAANRQAEPKVASPYFREVSVEGWKSISKQTPVRFGRLTILAGANSSGKSSFFQPILMLKQTLEAPYDPGALLLDGPHVRFTEASQFLSRTQGDSATRDLKLRIAIHGENIAVTYRKSLSKPIDVLENTIDNAFGKVSVHRNSSQSELSSQLDDRDKTFLKNFAGEKRELRVYRNRCFLGLEVSFRRKNNVSMGIQLAGFENGSLINAIRSVIHLPGLRGNQERLYPINATEGSFPGPFQQYTASIIQRWKDVEDEKKIKELNNALVTLGLAAEITTKLIDETRVELQVSRLPKHRTDDYVSIADVGLAVSQVLPVLVALVAAKPGQLIFVEQPELHLHPRAQVHLAGLIVAAVKRGVQILVETHSSLLLLGLQTAVAEGDLPKDDVILHWFSRNADGVTCTDEAKLDQSGAFGDWPQDFSDVSLDAENAYLDAAEQALLEAV